MYRPGANEELVPEVHGRGPRAARTAYHGAKAVARVGGACGPSGSSGCRSVGLGFVLGFALLEPEALAIHLEDEDVTCRSAATGVGRLRLVGTTFTIAGYVGDAVRNDILPSGHEPQVPQQKHHELRLEAVIGLLGSSADEIPEYVTVGYSCGFHRTQDIAS